MKYIKLISAFVAALIFVSCGGSDNSESEPQTPAKELTSLKVDYSATVSQHLLDVATVTVRYVGDNGQVASEQMSSTTWAKSVTITLPAKAGMSIQPTLKGSVTDGEYTLSAKGQMSYSWLDQYNQPLKAGLTENTPDLEAKFFASGLGQYLGAISANCQLARNFAKDYTVSETTIAWGANTGDDSTQSTGIATDGATDENR
jgi:hypothetical protein